MPRFIIASLSALHSSSHSFTIFLELGPFVSGAEAAAGAALVEFGLVVSANAVKCWIAIPVSAPQTKQKRFFIFRLLLVSLYR
jgi:hypothetical protein